MKHNEFNHNVPSEITSEQSYIDRRKFILGALALPAISIAQQNKNARINETPPVFTNSFSNLKRSTYSDYEEKLTSFEQVTSYGNFYEFGPDKSSPSENAHRLITDPWTISIEGEVKKPFQISLDEIYKLAPFEERIYRMRCVEGWSMVIPWIGIPFNALIKKANITGNAKFVEFYTLKDEATMPYVKVPFLPWPYMEAIRLDEAMNPLTLLGLGMYGKTMPRQNGAPVRLVVPWKYGFKGAKSIVRIRFVENQPETIWTRTAPEEYGFYGNVNPNVPHRRWSQASERRIGEFFKRKTLMFNGYEQHVASMYAGMDLARYY